MSRLLDAARRLVARFVPGAGARPPADEADAYEATVRQAFLSADGIEPAAPRRRSPGSPPDNTLEGASVAGAPASASPASTWRVARPAAPDTPPLPPAVEPAPKPAVAVPATQSAPGLIVTSPGAETAPDAPRTPDTADRPARPRRHQAGETAPGHLMLPTTGVDSAADDFFDGLKRQVEADR